MPAAHSPSSEPETEVTSMGKIKKCTACTQYTLQDTCPECDEDTREPGPPSFSPEDKYGEYRRKTKQSSTEE